MNENECTDEKCPMHFRVDFESAPGVQFRACTYAGDFAVVTTMTSVEEIILQGIMGGELPPDGETVVIRVGGTAAICDIPEDSREIVEHREYYVDDLPVFETDEDWSNWYLNQHKDAVAIYGCLSMTD